MIKYRTEIDGLRALAVVPVILFHAGFKAFSGGFVGVDVFFVISGYLITTILLNDLVAGKFSLVHFYERRARRILPALFLVMFACLPFAWFWLLPQDMKSFSQSLVAVSVFASNILFWQTSGYFDTATELKPLIHTWSLSVEEQYYVLFPLFLLFAWKLGKRWVLGILAVVAVVSLGMAQWGAYTKPAFTFYMLPTRAWELLMGAFVAFYYSEHNIKKHRYWASELGSILGFALIGYATFAYNDTTPFPSLYALVPTMGAAFIIIFATNKTLVGRLLSSKPFLWIGLISYSAYLWHQPLFAFARHRSLEEPSLQLLAILACLTLPLAYLTWRFIERPFRNKHLVSRTTLFLWAALASVAFICIGLAGHFTKGFDSRKGMEEFQQLNYSTDELGYIDCKTSFKEEGHAEINYCHSTAKGKVNAIIIGDSHADDKFYGIEKNDPSRNWAIIGNSSCPPVLDVDVEADQKNCREKFIAILDKVVNDQRVETVVLSFFGNYPLETAYAADHIIKNRGPGSVKISSSRFKGSSRSDLFYKGLASFVQRLQAANKNIYVVVDIPELPYIPYDCMKGKPNCEIKIQEVIERQNVHRTMLAKLQKDFPNIKVFDPLKIFCNSERCTYKSEKTVMYRDSHHLTLGGSDLYGQALSDWLNNP